MRGPKAARANPPRVVVRYLYLMETALRGKRLQASWRAGNLKGQGNMRLTVWCGFQYTGAVLIESGTSVYKAFWLRFAHSYSLPTEIAGFYAHLRHSYALNAN